MGWVGDEEADAAHQLATLRAPAAPGGQAHPRLRPMADAGATVVVAIGAVRTRRVAPRDTSEIGVSEIGVSEIGVSEIGVD